MKLIGRRHSLQDFQRHTKHYGLELSKNTGVPVSLFGENSHGHGMSKRFESTDQVMNCVHFETWNFAKVQPRQWDGTWLQGGSSTTGALSSWKIILGAEKWCKLDQLFVISIYYICLCLSTNPETFSDQKFAWAKVFWDTTAVDILWSMTQYMQMCPTMTHSRYANKDSYFKPKSYLSCRPIPSWVNAFQQSCNVVSTNEITGSVLPIFYNYLWVPIEICVHLQTSNENQHQSCAATWRDRAYCFNASVESSGDLWGHCLVSAGVDGYLDPNIGNTGALYIVSKEKGELFWPFF